ncbi:hypothetical protein [Shimia abyssi]|uniref:Uncharacterized protein n=1 Tax=Shimia abyssi TaxID=1662395 RepID=A0A2P8FJA8_9RHOB|nr:hypothetical protein [Shimia abyssi]PSL21795.1 hypothetical protein CLV88_101219 [Shimia abyssi]
MKKLSYIAAALALSAMPAMAQQWSSNAPNIGPVNQPEGVLIQPYPASANYCPAGLQPVTIGGVICCGQPNTTEPFYNRAGGKRHHYRSSSCPAGVKGCS